MSEPKPAISKIELRPWENADWPLLWHWLQFCWDKVSDHFMPRDIDNFIDAYKNLNLTSFGVYYEGELGGFFAQKTITPVSCSAHCVFKRPFWRRRVAIPAIQAGMETAWRMGYWAIECVVFEDNDTMRGLLEEVGGVYEGKLRSRTWRNGNFANFSSYVLLR